MTCFTRHALLPVLLPEFCERIKQTFIPNSYWWRISNILCHVTLKAESSDIVSFSMSVFLRIGLWLCLTVQTVWGVRNSFVHSKLTPHTSFHSNPIQLLRKIQHLFKPDCYTGMTLTIASVNCVILPTLLKPFHFF